VTTNRPVRRWIGTVLPAGLACLVACLASGCSSAAPGASSGAVPSAYATPAGTVCGTSRTAANTPVIIKVTKGTVSCAAAVAVENGYTELLKSGTLKGNGGAAPAQVSGWTCQGYPTPRILQDGVTSECKTASADVVAVLDMTAPTSTPGG
jgi:hypothetical protein